MQTTQNWAVRCLHESQLYPENSFLTLTYRQPNYSVNPETDLPTAKPVDKSEDARELPTSAPNGLEGPNIARVDNSRSKLKPRGGGEMGLSKTDHQLFLKRYREKHGPLRFYMCGEYGKNLNHPHYHYLIFGHAFKDRYYWKTSSSGEKLYRSAELEQLWPFGHAWIGDVTYESCAYVAAYVMKKINGPMADWHYRKTDEAGNDYWLPPEFALMSRGGRKGRGIAATWLDEFRDDVYTDDHIIRNAVKCKPPRYYDKLLALFDPVRWEVIKLQREIRARELTEDNTPARLADKEVVMKAKLALKKRQLETL